MSKFGIILIHGAAITVGPSSYIGPNERMSMCS